MNITGVMDIGQCEMNSSTADLISDAIMNHIVEQSTGLQFFGVGKPSAKQVAAREAEANKAEEVRKAAGEATKAAKESREKKH